CGETHSGLVDVLRDVRAAVLQPGMQVAQAFAPRHARVPADRPRQRARVRGEIELVALARRLVPRLDRAPDDPLDLLEHAQQADDVPRPAAEIEGAAGEALR